MSSSSPPAKYDENLEDNPFLQDFRSSFPELLSKTISEEWLICVPRADSLPPELSLRPEDVCRHIIVPEEGGGSEGKYYSLADKRLLIQDKNIIKVFDTCGKFELSRIILFSEVFYTEEDLKKYKVLCLDGYLGEDPRFSSSSEGVSSQNFKLSSTRHCIQYLFEQVDPEALRKIEASCTGFSPQKTSVESLFNASLKRIKGGVPLTEPLRAALETYVLFLVSEPLCKTLRDTHLERNAALNRSLSGASMAGLFGRGGESLNSSSDGESSSLVKCRSELAHFPQYATPLDKLECLGRSLGFLLGKLDSCDDLLQSLILVIRKSSFVRDWWSQLIHMKDYRFSSMIMTGEYDYLLASLEAALEHLMAETHPGPTSIDIQSEQPDTLELFSAVKASDWDTVCSTLRARVVGVEEGNEEDRHHPLCNCDICSKKFSHLSINYQENRFGFTLLHVAALNGDSKMVDILLNSFKADPTITDIKSRTPLHLACTFGRQDVILLILQNPLSHGILNLRDADGRTPLHLSTLFGHESSSKGILYFAEHQSYPLSIDAQDKFGDTALHAGASLGHSPIVRLLLEYSANAGIRNKRGQSPGDVSLCPKVEKLIQSYGSKERFNYFAAPGDNQHPQVNDDDSPPISSSKSERFFKSILMGDLELVSHILGVNSHRETLRSRLLYYQSTCYPGCGGCEGCKGLLVASSESSISVKEDLTRPTSPPLHLNGRNSEGKTGVHVCAQLGQVDVLGLLLDLGAEPFPSSPETGESPLHLACQNGHLGVVLLLLLLAGGRAHVDDKDQMGNTALMYAAMSGNYEIAIKLLGLGASVKAKNLAGDSPVDIAKLHDNATLALLFTKHS